ncbi:MAG: restriction endonuclease [Nevskia sp.]|nr:restriction endonuclease [Nevskia sp.]
MLVGKRLEDHATSVHAHLQKESERQQELEKIKRNHAALVAEIQAKADTHNADIEAFRMDYDSGEPHSIALYSQLVLEQSALPDCFPRSTKAAFITESKQLLIEYDLPSIDDAVPEMKSYKYVKASDEVIGTSRPELQRKSLYASLVGQTVLRSVHEVFASDTPRFIESIVLNAYVNSVDRGTGRSVRPCVVTVRTTRDAFGEIDLRRVDSLACLRALNAGVSKNPSELVPVRPILELKMVDPRFVQEEDVLSTLDQRPNLMDLNPSEFESLITNLFKSMGLETKMTQASRDGGVDCVAYDPRPIFGGKVIIQAKRYKNTVGVSAVRDLFGTMQNEGASKGILVTTSGL